MNPLSESTNPFNESFQEWLQSKVFIWSGVSTLVPIILSMILLNFYANEYLRSMSITVGCLFFSSLLVLWSVIILNSSTGWKPVAYFLRLIPLLVGVMFIYIGVTLKRQEDGTYKMGDSEPPFGKTTGPEAYYIAGSMLIVQFLVLMYLIYFGSDPSFNKSILNQQDTESSEPGIFERLKNKFASSAYLDGDGIPNFQWKCTKAGDEWHCKAEKN